MERRKFIKATCQVCLLAAAGSVLPSFISYAGHKSKVYKTELNENNQAIIPLALFEENKLQIVRVKKTFYDIAVHQQEDGSYMALLMKCSHMDNQLQATDEGFRCSLHGSEYDAAGVVTKGPAEVSLTKYETIINEGNLLITIPKTEEE